MSDTLQHLKEASQDLLFPSESDYPLVPFEWPQDKPLPTSAALLLSGTGYPGDTPVQTLNFEEFFAFKIEERDDQDAPQRAGARRLKTLVEVLQSQLSELRVYKLGSLKFDVFILGHDAQGRWLGLSTQVVET